MEWLMFDLASPLASFGSVAPGEVRDTELLPSRSALLGLLGAALGLQRADATGQRALADKLRLAARVCAGARLERDYHTAQAPPQPALKGRPRATRRDELRVPKDDLNTVLSDRYYYADYASTIGVVGPAELLDECLRALKAPHFTLYLGRKCCAPGWPIDPLRLNAPTWAEALACHDADTNAKLQQFARFGADRWLRASSNVHSLDEQIQPGDLNSIQRSVWRWDEPIDTARRLYANRSHKRFDQQMATSKMESSP